MLAHTRTHARALFLQSVPQSVLVPPYDYAPVIAGQGTMALEILDQVGRAAWLLINCCLVLAVMAQTHTHTHTHTHT